MLTKQKHERKRELKMIKKIKDNWIQLIETLILIACIVVPLLIDVKEMFGQYLDENYLTPDNAIPYLLIKSGKYVVAIGLFTIAFLRIRKHNKVVTMNRMNVYHDYSYVWYCYCAKFLGIEKCNLVLVPIHMQFKLVIQSVFNEFPMDETAYPVQDNEAEIKKSIANWSSCPTEISLLLEDTYPIVSKQIPPPKRNLPTLKISRNDGKSVGRHFSQKFIESIINGVRELDNGVKINVFATTNPMNTYNIAKQVFTNADRGNVAELYVYQQESSQSRLFKDKGKKIF